MSTNLDLSQVVHSSRKTQIGAEEDVSSNKTEEVVC